MPAGFVVQGDDLPFQLFPGGGEHRVAIDRKVGCRNMEQRVIRLPSGPSPPTVHENSENVIYVVDGRGRAMIGGRAHRVEPDMGLLVPPGKQYHFEVDAPGGLELVSVLSPQPGRPAPAPSPDAAPVDNRRLTVHARDEESLPAGDDRSFKLLIDPRFGSRYVTHSSV
jgi:mannose-6-phosphate isomerase-like protein (cupin superfamily)